jgi:hypothetical protein
VTIEFLLTNFKGLKDMFKKILTSSSAMGVALIMTSSWVGQAHAFVYNGVNSGGTSLTLWIPYTCQALQGSYGSGIYNSGTAYATWTGCGADDTRFKPSTAVTSGTALRTATAQMTGLISSRIAAMRNPGMRKMASSQNLLGEGLSTGDGKGMDAWVNTAWSHPKNTLSSTAFNGDVFTGMVGVDYDLAPDMRAGLGFGYEATSFSTAINRGHVRSRGVALVPYVSYDFDDMVTFDLQAGFEHLDYDLSRMDPALTEYQHRITADTTGSRWFTILNANTGYEYDHFTFRGRTGLTYAHERRTSYNDTSAYFIGRDVDVLGRWDLGVTVGYDMDMMVEPFLGVNALWDFHQDTVTVHSNPGYSDATAPATVTKAGQEIPSHSRFAVIYSAGLKMDMMKNLNATLTGTAEEHRRHYHNYGVMFSVNSGF